MQVCIIVAKSSNHVIGNDNRLIWKLPADLAYFKKVTTGHPIIMGRKTFESIGRPLPKRTNIIITRSSTYTQKGCFVFNSLKTCIESLKKEYNKVFIIGGGEIYRLAMPYATELFVTEVKERFEGDTFFPAINSDEWQETSRIVNAPDTKNCYHYDFVTYTRTTKSI